METPLTACQFCGKDDKRASLEGMAGELAEALREVCMSRQVIVHVPDSALDRWRAALARYDALKEKSR